MGAIFYSSSRPVPSFFQVLPNELWHFLGYVFLVVLAMRALNRGLAMPASATVRIASVALSLSYAASDEVHQGFVPGRVASLEDFVVDAAGVGAGWILLAVWWRLRGRGERTPSVPPLERSSDGNRGGEA